MIPNQQIFPGFFCEFSWNCQVYSFFQAFSRCTSFIFGHTTLSTLLQENLWFLHGPTSWVNLTCQTGNWHLPYGNQWEPICKPFKNSDLIGSKKKQKTDAFPDIKVQIVSQIIPSSFVERPLREWLQFWSLQTSLEKKCRIEKNPWN